MSNVSPQHYHSQSSTIPPTTYHQPHSADTSQSDLGLSPTDNLIENLTNTLAFLTPSIQNSVDRTEDRLSAPTATDNAIDEDVDEQLVQDLALNVDNVFQADDCDAYDSDVDEAPTAQTMFMENLSSADPVYDEAEQYGRFTSFSAFFKESVDTLREIVSSSTREKLHTTPRKKQVTFEDQIATSSSTTHKHVEPMHTQQSNVPVPPSTGVNSCTDASGSQPRSILKKHKIPPAKSDSMKKVEEHPRTIRSSLKTTNHVDSSISSKRTVWICQTSQEISQKRTRERMSDQEAKEIKAEAKEIMPQPSSVNFS
ncbi:hypothetical protein Tco_1459382 [Tanacetum coccineum]